MVTGEMVSVLNTHYKAVTSIMVSQDGYSVISAGGDGMVCQTSMADFLDSSSSSSKYLMSFLTKIS